MQGELCILLPPNNGVRGEHHISFHGMLSECWSHVFGLPT